MMDEERILEYALQWFALSTMHGEEAHKLMPISDAKSLIVFAQLIEQKTREECAKVCEQDSMFDYDPVQTQENCAAAIREGK